MSDAEYDVFSGLDALCKNKTLRKFKGGISSTLQTNSSSDDEHDLDAVLRRNSDDALRLPEPKPKRNTRKKREFAFSSTITTPPTSPHEWSFSLPVPTAPIVATAATTTAAKSKATTANSKATTAKATSAVAKSKAKQSAVVAAAVAAASQSNGEMSASMSAVMNDAIKAAMQAAIAESRNSGAATTRRNTRSAANLEILASVCDTAMPSLLPPQPLPRGRPKRNAALAAAQAVTSTKPTAPPPVAAPAAAAKRARGRKTKTAAVAAVISTSEFANNSGNSSETNASDSMSQPPRRNSILQFFQRNATQNTPQNISNNSAPAGISTRNRNRNQLVAQMAALAPTVGFVDLIKSPMPPINGVINVDSDEEDGVSTASSTARTATTQPTVVTKRESLDMSFEEDNPELSVKFIWNGEPEVFKLRKYQKFLHLFKALAARENTDVENVVFNLDSKIITAQDTPASINYKIYNFIDGRVLTSKLLTAAAPVKKARDANRITLKIQSDQWKRPLQVDLLKTDAFKILYIKCSEELGVAYANLKLSFDGELLEYNGTPLDLEFEGGEAIDLRVKK